MRNGLVKKEMYDSFSRKRQAQIHRDMGNGQAGLEAKIERDIFAKHQHLKQVCVSQHSQFIEEPSVTQANKRKG